MWLPSSGFTIRTSGDSSIRTLSGSPVGTTFINMCPNPFSWIDPWGRLPEHVSILIVLLPLAELNSVQEIVDSIEDGWKLVIAS